MFTAAAGEVLSVPSRLSFFLSEGAPGPSHTASAVSPSENPTLLLLFCSVSRNLHLRDLIVMGPRAHTYLSWLVADDSMNLQIAEG